MSSSSRRTRYFTSPSFHYATNNSDETSSVEPAPANHRDDGPVRIKLMRFYHSVVMPPPLHLVNNRRAYEEYEETVSQRVDSILKAYGEDFRSLHVDLLEKYGSSPFEAYSSTPMAVVPDGARRDGTSETLMAQYVDGSRLAYVFQSGRSRTQQQQRAVESIWSSMRPTNTEAVKPPPVVPMKVQEDGFHAPITGFGVR